MGVFGNAGARIRSLLRWDKEQVTATLAKGATSSMVPAAGFDLLQQYGYDSMSEYLRIEQDLISRYVDYESFDEYPETAGALNAYADDATLVEPLKNHAMWVDSPDRTIKEIGEDLFHSRLRMDDELWPKARGLAKYGSDYDEIVVTDDGVVAMNALPPPTMRRIEGRRGELFGFIQDFRGKFSYSPEEFKALISQRTLGNTDQQSEVAAFEDWEVSHVRLRSKQRRSMYGQSILESSRWIMKRLMLLEDAAMVFRLERAPQRYAFYVDVGDMPPKEAYAYLNKVRQSYAKTKYYNAATGKMDMKNNPLGQSESFFVPVRKGEQSSKIDVLNAPAWSSIEDLEFFRLKLFASLSVPKTYLGFGDSVGKGTLSQEDVRFARSVLRLQREMRYGLYKIMRVHLAALNINPAAVQYEIYMTVPSAIFELAQLEVRNAKADFAGRMSQFVSLHWILSKIFGLSDEEVEYVVRERHDEQMADAEIQAKAMGLQTQITGDVQMNQQQQAMTQAGAGPSRPAQETVDLARQIHGMSHMWSQKRQQNNYKPITEKELFHGNRDHEKRMEDNFHKMISENRGLATRLDNLKGLVDEIRMAKPKF